MAVLQRALFEELAREEIVNVASVPQRSPFRYPGGKTWLIPRLRAWLTSRVQPAEFVEPFAGGAICSLTVAFEHLANHVTMGELDADVAAVWRAVINGDPEWLAHRIETFTLTHETLAAELARPARSLRERAWKTILRNRTVHGGILAPGSGVLKYGEAGRGLQSRWYPQTLARRIREVKSVRSRITFEQRDAFEMIREFSCRKQAVLFLDPPYTAGTNGKRAGTRLYSHWEIDHERLFRVASKFKGDVLMTYDNDAHVLELARAHGFDTRLVAMKNTHHAEMTELLIGRNLEWAR